MVVTKGLEMFLANEIVNNISNEGEYSCENSIPNLIIWNPMILFIDEQVIIKKRNKRSMYYLPFGHNLESGINTILKIERGLYPIFYVSEGRRLDEFKNGFGEKFVFIEDRDSFDYIYLRENLVNLPGRKYHSKRNHISAFSRKYDWHYETLTDENIDKFRECAIRWYQSRDDANNTLEIERKGIELLFDHYKELNIIGGGIVVDNNIVAFSLGSEINPEMFDVCIEKALPEYAEAYAVINREFAKNLDYTYINREDDMGIEGLRKAKLSYHPEFFVKKYYCYPKEENV